MPTNSFSVSGTIVDVVRGKIFSGEIQIKDGKILQVAEKSVDNPVFILPGLIDAHVHIESSMLVPSEFARLAVTHGTVATVSDPHEIANVLGVEGVKFMIDNGKKVPLKFYFGAPSCVPATSFETAGAVLGVKETGELLALPEIHYLSEMMNFPGVLKGDKEVMAKLDLARKYGKPVDGHAPGLRGSDAVKYIQAGISTDHECFSLEEAVEKAAHGMKILIREGSAARNFEELAPMLELHPEKVMFCSDDRHPDDLVKRHIDDIVRRALAKGYDPVTVLRACTLNPVRHYGLQVGLLQEGDSADLILVDSLENFNAREVYIDGRLVAKGGVSLIRPVEEKPVNHFNAGKISATDLLVEPIGKYVKVINVIDGQLVTTPGAELAKVWNGNLVSNPELDVLKLTVINRYQPSPPAMAFVKGFGLKNGAIASTVAHDSHNIIAVGTSDDQLARAVNALVDAKGGICCTNGDQIEILPLPVAGLMSVSDGFKVSESYEMLNARAKELGSNLASPFMSLSFMALLVIPSLKLSDKGLFDGNRFEYTSLFLDQI